MADGDRYRGGAVPARKREAALSDVAYDKIKHRIITLRFRPGEHLNEARVCDALGIGRTPVHQAFCRLALEGMVEIIPRKGVIVRPVSLNEVMEIIEARLVNEAYCARLACERADAADIEALSRVLEKSRAAAAKPDVEKLMLLDRDFHGALTRAAKNTVLADVLRNLHERSLRFWFISLTDRGHHAAVESGHAAILAAIEARDGDAAAEAVRTHVEAFRRNVARRI